MLLALAAASALAAAPTVATRVFCVRHARRDSVLLYRPAGIVMLIYTGVVFAYPPLVAF